MKIRTISMTDKEAVAAMLREKQGRATVRTLDFEDLAEAAASADDLLGFVGMSKAKRQGLCLTVEQGAAATSKKWSGDMSCAELNFDKRKGWCLVNVRRTFNNGSRFRWRLTAFPRDLSEILAKWRD